MKNCVLFLCLLLLATCGSSQIPKTHVQEPTRISRLTKAVDAFLTFETRVMRATDARIATRLSQMTQQMQVTDQSPTDLCDCISQTVVLLDELFRTEQESLLFYAPVQIMVQQMMQSPVVTEEAVLKNEMRRMLHIFRVKTSSESLEVMYQAMNIVPHIRQNHIRVWSKDRVDFLQSIQHLKNEIKSRGESDSPTLFL